MCDTDVNYKVLTGERLAQAATRLSLSRTHVETHCALGALDRELRAFRAAQPQATAASEARSKSAADANHELDRLPPVVGWPGRKWPGQEARVANPQGGQYR